MFITDLFRDEASTLRYTYFIRGTETHKYPNVRGEKADGPWFSVRDGQLFCGEPIAYDGYGMLDYALDIVLDLGGRYFLDRLTTKLYGTSEIASFDVLDGDGRLVGRAIPAETNGGKAFTINLGCFAEKLTLRIGAVYQTLAIESVSLIAAGGLEETVYPLPTKAEYGKEILPFTAITGITADKMAAGEIFKFLRFLFLDKSLLESLLCIAESVSLFGIGVTRHLKERPGVLNQVS